MTTVYHGNGIYTVYFENEWMNITDGFIEELLFELYSPKSNFKIAYIEEKKESDEILMETIRSLTEQNMELNSKLERIMEIIDETE